ncbi:MAG: glycosyltransferase family 2 protein [Sumerlaeia bacterium]
MNFPDTPPQKPALTLVVPIYNEEKALPPFFLELESLKKKIPEGLFLVFVDDGSRDRSSELIEAYCNEQVKLVRHSRNRGYGAALKSGIAQASTELIAICDADLTYPLSALPPLLELIVEGNRMAIGKRPLAQQPLIRRPAKYFLNWFASYLSATKIEDLNSGLRIFRKQDALRFSRMLPEGFSFTSTITMLLACEGHSLAYRPIRYRTRVGSSKISPVKDFFGFSLLVLRLSMAFNPLKVFAPLSIMLFALSAFLLCVRLFFDELGLATTIVLFTAGMQLLATGLLADLVNRRLSAHDEANTDSQNAPQR